MEKPGLDDIQPMALAITATDPVILMNVGGGYK